MAITVENFELTSLTDLSQSDVSQILAQIISQLQELNPDYDFKRGVFKDTIAYSHAVLNTALRTTLERYQSARSLKKIIETPALADADITDEVLSNWGVTRQTGTAATGSVTIELTNPNSVVIPAGFRFVANGLNYLTTQTFVSRQTEAQIINSADRLIIPLSNGNYAFTVDVVAESIGSGYKLNAGDLILPVSSLVNFVTSYATSSFDTGTNPETNAELIEKLQQGIAAKTLSNRVNMRAYLRSIPGFASITNQSIIGFGDPEMLRDKHTIMPIACGGRVDWYVRGQQALKRQTVTANATCVGIAENSSTWQLAIGRSVLPGFYTVERIRRQVDSGNNSGFELIQDTRGLDLTNLTFVPDIAVLAEGAYTAFQTATIRFRDTVTNIANLTVGQTASYTYELTGTPLIQEIQTLVSSRDVRSYGADALVKAPVPCFVQVTLTVNKTLNDITPDIEAIKRSIVELVNKTDFCGRLDGSRIVDTVHTYLSQNMSITDLDLLGIVRRPDSSLLYLRDNDSLKIPNEFARMVTAKTVQFYTEITSISVNVTSSIPTVS